MIYADISCRALSQAPGATNTRRCVRVRLPLTLIRINKRLQAEIAERKEAEEKLRRSGTVPGKSKAQSHRKLGFVNVDTLLVKPFDNKCVAQEYLRQWKCRGSSGIRLRRLDGRAVDLVLLREGLGVWDPPEEYWREEGQPIDSGPSRAATVALNPRNGDKWSK